MVGRNSRNLDQSRIGPILMGDKMRCGDGPPVKAIFIQNTNPDDGRPRNWPRCTRDCARRPFRLVHEQFMTETAKMADVVLPATMFLEHTDLYQGGGHQHILLGPEGY